jgi:predicted transposase/invertase (TIGR01784 family)
MTILPTNDLAFKKIFASETNKDILSGLIADFLNIKADIKDITIKNPYDIKTYKESIPLDENNKIDIIKMRQTSRDVGASLISVDFSAEIQVQKDDYFAERSLYYTFSLYCNNYNRRELMEHDLGNIASRYSSLRPVLSLNILRHSFFDDEFSFRNFILHDPERNLSFDAGLLRIAYFEIDKELSETQNHQYWKEYFLTGTAPNDCPEYIKKAATVIKFENLAQEEKDMINTFERAQANYESELYTAIREGMREGKREVVINMMQAGVDHETIERFTGIPQHEITRISQETNGSDDDNDA